MSASPPGRDVLEDPSRSREVGRIEGGGEGRVAVRRGKLEVGGSCQVGRWYELPCRYAAGSGNYRDQDSDGDAWPMTAILRIHIDPLLAVFVTGK